MFARRLLHKALHHSEHNLQQYSSLTSADLDLQIAVHYGVPATASILAFDHIQRLLAIGTLDGRIKVIGGDGIEGLLISPKQLPYKYIEFVQNQGVLVSITNDNEIQVWNLETRSLAFSLQWESNITAFSVISGSCFMYIGNEYGLMSVVKYDSDEGKLMLLPYNISAKALEELAGFPIPDQLSVVGVLPQPCSFGERVLIAYENGLLILWDVSEAQIVFVGGGKDLHLKDARSPSEADSNLPDDTSEHHLSEKEISALCWASSDGSILAVGYIDGDILFWNTSNTVFSKGQQRKSSNNVIKLKLSSAERRLPVIILHWSTNNGTRSDSHGRLFVYGGDEIGAEEVITVLSLEWSSGMQSLRCVGRVDLTLNGAFADMILLPGAGATAGHHKSDIFVLTSPGQLHLYDDASMSNLLSQKERKPSASGVDFPAVVPTANPSMTVAKFSIIPTGETRQKIASIMNLGSSPTLAGGMKWPLTGGLPSQLSINRSHDAKKVYIAGYQDGSVRIWDATYPVLMLICILEGKVQGIEVANASAPVSNLTYCSVNSSLAVGNDSGLVRIYNLNGNSDASNFYLVSETNHEVHKLPEGKGPQCMAAFSLVNSPVLALEFSNCGAKVAVGFQCGQVAVLDMSSMSILFFTDCISGHNSQIIAMTWTLNHSEIEIPDKPVEEVILMLFKDTALGVIDGGTGKLITSPHHLKRKATAISMYVIGQRALCEFTAGKHLEQSDEDTAAKNKTGSESISNEIDSNETEHISSPEAAFSGEILPETLVLLCCEDSLQLYSKNYVIQGKKKTLHKVKHAKPCCWTSTIKKDGKVFGLLLLFHTGVFEIRSLPDLELVKESSIMSILRWNFKPNMYKTMASDDGQITMTNGSEVAILSLLAAENGFGIQESLPLLHDKVVAAAADAAFHISSNQKKKQNTTRGFLDGIINGFKVGKGVNNVDIKKAPKSSFAPLEETFLKPPFPDSSSIVTNNEEDPVLDIDDIEIDDVPPTATTSPPGVTYTKTETGSERERLFGEPDDSKPKRRTYEEIMAKYRPEDASSAAAHARNKLMERQDKLERISRRTAELESGAEDFSNLANELVKAMEKRKWYHI